MSDNVHRRDFYAEYLAWFNGSSWRRNDPSVTPLTREQFYINFPDTKPKNRENDARYKKG